MLKKLATTVALGATVEEVGHVADVVAVVVGQEHPADVGGVDDRRHGVEPLLAVQRGAGVDDDGLLGEDHQRVHEHVRAGLGRDEVGDQVRVGGDALRLGDGGSGSMTGSLVADRARSLSRVRSRPALTALATIDGGFGARIASEHTLR